MIKKCAMTVFEHVVRRRSQGGLGYSNDQVTLYGRSMGTGPSSLLACKYKPRGCILMSPYTTIKDVAKNMVGGFLSMFI